MTYGFVVGCLLTFIALVVALVFVLIIALGIEKVYMRLMGRTHTDTMIGRARTKLEGNFVDE